MLAILWWLCLVVCCGYCCVHYWVLLLYGFRWVGLIGLDRLFDHGDGHWIDGWLLLGAGQGH